ncbi:hypothetical protein L345_08174, partial [Ophiophagus hannah]
MKRMNSSFTRDELLNEARAMDKARFNYVLRLYGLFVGKMPIDATSASAIVSDFGLSKFRRGTTQQCNLNSGEISSCGGTLEFMPPESFVDFKYKPASSTDVYRPRTEDLEKQADQVLKLENLIDLMKRCWSNEKDQRPSFQ